MAAGSLNGDGEWFDLLASNPLFQELRLSGRDAPRDICEIRGDVFAWNDREKTLLTTNLKRLMANPDSDQVFQHLNCTRRPEGCVARLLPEPSGSHVALQCERELSVVRLFRLRGKHGEFGGGQERVTCKVTQVASKYFQIHDDQFTLVQAAWHPTTPGAIVLLTSDNVLRLFNIANPNNPLVEVALLEASTTVGVYFKSHGYTLDYPFVAFSLWRSSAFAIRDSGEVYLVPLASGPGNSPGTPPSPLLMHPQADDNYPGDPTSLLVLPTTPCSLVIANSSGVLHHCIYLEPDGEEEEEGTGHSTQMLYVVESIQIECRQTDTTKLTLVPDPVEKHTYYVIHPSGVHKVDLPWLSSLETFAATDLLNMIPDAESTVIHLIDTNVQGLVVLNEPLLGHLVIVTTSEGGVLSLPLQDRSEEHHRTVTEPPPTPRSQQQRAVDYRPIQVSEFERRIQTILHPPGEDTAPVIRSSSGNEDLSQEECYRFLTTTTKHINRAALIRHRKALETINQRIAMLVQQKELLISEMESLRGRTEDVRDYNIELVHRLENIEATHHSLMVRVKSAVLRVESQSPVISEAESCMLKEVEGLRDHLEGRMKQRVFEARRKLQLCRDASCSPPVSLSKNQSITILKALTESGEYVKNLMKQVQSLREVTPT